MLKQQYHWNTQLIFGEFLINSEINLIATWSKNCVISSATGKTENGLKMVIE